VNDNGKEGTNWFMNNTTITTISPGNPFRRHMYVHLSIPTDSTRKTVLRQRGIAERDFKLLFGIAKQMLADRRRCYPYYCKTRTSHSKLSSF
jgi:hypothetical protein